MGDILHKVTQISFKLVHLKSHPIQLISRLIDVVYDVRVDMCWLKFLLPRCHG